MQRIEELTIPGLLAGITERMPDEVCLVQGREVFSFRRLQRMANGFSLFLSRAGVDNARPGPDGMCDAARVGILLRTCPAYLVAMLGSAIHRAAAFNINYRYTVDELTELFRDAAPHAVVVHDEFATAAAEALRRADVKARLIQVADAHGAELVPGASRWSEIEALAGDDPSSDSWSPDDPYLLFTGGTTGKPKGVLWRQADALVSAFVVVDKDGSEFPDLAAAVEAAANRRHRRIVMSAPPLMHGAGQWFALGALLGGGKVVLPEDAVSFDAESIVDAICRESVTELMVVGDALARPLVHHIAESGREMPQLRTVINGGAALSSGIRARLLELVPGLRIIDGMGSSESGRQAVRHFTASESISSRAVQMQAMTGTAVLSEDRTRILTPREPEIGWLARAGRIPLGYLNDPEKTRQTFPAVDGRRYVIPGDRARYLEDGTIEILGREANTVNTGGEKVFGEEVEAVLLSHPTVLDCLVVGQPDEQWGERIVAIVATNTSIDSAELVAHVGQQLARYKLPKTFLFVDSVPRTPAGKADYPAARALLSLSPQPHNAPA